MGSTGQVFNEMCRYKEKGEAMPMAVIESIPINDRLPGLTQKYGIEKVSAVLSKAITKTLSNFNLRVGMNSDQVVELSLMLIESSEEDQLAFEDIMLFLDGLSKGKHGKVYDRMDIPTFFELLENYREQRHKDFIRHKEEKESQFKSYGNSSRMSDDLDTEKEANRNAMAHYLKNYPQK